MRAAIPPRARAAHRAAKAAQDRKAEAAAAAAERAEEGEEKKDGEEESKEEEGGKKGTGKKGKKGKKGRKDDPLKGLTLYEWVETGTQGKIFRTNVRRNVREGSEVTFDSRFRTPWRGSYIDLWGKTIRVEVRACSTLHASGHREPRRRRGRSWAWSGPRCRPPPRAHNNAPPPRPCRHGIGTSRRRTTFCPLATFH